MCGSIYPDRAFEDLSENRILLSGLFVYKNISTGIKVYADKRRCRVLATATVTANGFRMGRWQPPKADPGLKPGPPPPTRRPVFWSEDRPCHHHKVWELRTPSALFSLRGQPEKCPKMDTASIAKVMPWHYRNQIIDYQGITKSATIHRVRKTGLMVRYSPENRTILWNAVKKVIQVLCKPTPGFLQISGPTNH